MWLCNLLLNTHHQIIYNFAPSIVGNDGNDDDDGSVRVRVREGEHQKCDPQVNSPNLNTITYRDAPKEPTKTKTTKL